MKPANMTMEEMQEALEKAHKALDEKDNEIEASTKDEG
jgi:hypothetical protein